MMRQFFICLAFISSISLSASDEKWGLIPLSSSSSLQNPECENIIKGLRQTSQKSIGPIRRRLLDWHLSTMQEPRMAGLYEQDIRLKFRSFLTGMGHGDLFGDLYNRVYNLISRPKGLLEFLKTYLYSTEVRIDLETIKYEHQISGVEDFEIWSGGKSSSSVDRSIKAALFTGGENIEAISEKPFILFFGQQTFEAGNVVGESYRGEMRDDYYIFFENRANFDEFKKFLGKLTPSMTPLEMVSALGTSIRKACESGVLKSVLVVSKGREVFRYGESAGVLGFFDKPTWDWMKPWSHDIQGGKDLFLISSTSRKPDGSPLSIGRVYPHKEILSYIAARWTQLMRAQFFVRSSLKTGAEARVALPK